MSKLPRFVTTKYQKRANKVEFEHVVPAENFGRGFKEWRNGHPSCIDSKGKSFKGRSCALKVNTEFRYMYADMYNAVPSIGAVNALRSNYNFTMLPNESSDFGSCAMKIENRSVEPPEQSRGRIARTYLYMAMTYDKFKLSNKQRQIMEAWDKMYPISQWECQRAKRIESIQGNAHPILKQRCSS